jgi:NTP pyrophosphatase (non-canonical NTP hydrolase)
MKDAQEKLTLAEASARANEVRKLYHRLEESNHGTRWSRQEDMVGFLYDIGELGRLLMANEGRWVHEGDTRKELQDKLAECLWWILVLSDRLDIDITQAYLSKVKDLQAGLSASADSGKG